MEVEERQGWKRILDTGRMRKIFGLAWPSILENLATTITNIIDTVMVSPLGPAAVAAVGINSHSYQIVLIYSIFSHVSQPCQASFISYMPNSKYVSRKIFFA